ncbi:MAG: DUF1501 domain-containing protein [Verrucomicrobia bacterium]|nr:DUF1501 domain-containing protein [Verrucomicrobiota bacterium]
MLPTDFINRRDFLNKAGTGFGMLALASLLYPELTYDAVAQSSNAGLLSPKEPHFKPTAKRVLHIMLSGGQASQDTWNPAPDLVSGNNEGKTVEGGGKGMRGGRILPSQFKYVKQGKSGVEVSEIWKELGKEIDDIAVIRSMHTDVPAHEEATLIGTTGDFRLPKPSMGSWVVYGLGTENQNLPAFVVMNPGGFPTGGGKNWNSAFMPGAYQGTFVDSRNTKIEDIIENIKNTVTSAKEQRQQLDLLYQINEIHKQKRVAESQLDARIQSFELAFRMQTDAVEAFDISKEPESMTKMYGDSAQSRQFLIARRLLERGVRFVQVWHGGWDNHGGIVNAMTNNARGIDQPSAAIIRDLRQRGMLKDTLIVCSTEFGRSSTEDAPGGRTHNAKAFASWLAGGGIKGGQAWGSTNELGSEATDNKVHVHELHSTILHALGFDSEKLTYRNGGRDFRLTDVSGAQPVKGLFA